MTETEKLLLSALEQQQSEHEATLSVRDKAIAELKTHIEARQTHIEARLETTEVEIDRCIAAYQSLHQDIERLCSMLEKLSKG